MEIGNMLYLIFLCGLGLWQWNAVSWFFYAVKTRFFIRRNLRSITDDEALHQYGKIEWHLKLLIEGAEAEKIFIHPRNFLMISSILGVSSFCIFQWVISWQTAIFWAACVGFLPYSLLQARLHERRVERSKEGDILVQELLNNYQIHHYNMLDAVEQTAMHIDGAPLGKKVYLQLAKGMQSAVTKKEVEQILSSFRYAFDTAWGNVLASNIFFGYLYGIRVDAALSDLLQCMTQSRKAVEYGRRENNEARLMLLYLAPISFLLSIFFGCRYFDFTLKKFMTYQFGTQLGLQWFLTIMFCYVISLLVHRFLAKEKMDI